MSDYEIGPDDRYIRELQDEIDVAHEHVRRVIRLAYRALKSVDLDNPGCREHIDILLEIRKWAGDYDVELDPKPSSATDIDF